jgi:hypothetical protein
MSASSQFHGFVSVQSRGLVALPTALRKRYRLDEPGAQVEITEREDGVLELRPTLAIPAHEAWFWDQRWQAGEREVDELVAAGAVIVTEGASEFLDSLPVGGTATE